MCSFEHEPAFYVTPWIWEMRSVQQRPARERTGKKEDSGSKNPVFCVILPVLRRHLTIRSHGQRRRQFRHFGGGESPRLAEGWIRNGRNPHNRHTQTGHWYSTWTERPNYPCPVIDRQPWGLARQRRHVPETEHSRKHLDVYRLYRRQLCTLLFDGVKAYRFWPGFGLITILKYVVEILRAKCGCRICKKKTNKPAAFKIWIRFSAARSRIVVLRCFRAVNYTLQSLPLIFICID